jgi:hypothetical protein
MAELLLMLVAFGCLLTLGKWRWGLALCILVAILQDPVRKVTPETPPYLTVAFVPIFLCMVVGLLRQGDPIRVFRFHFPELTAPLVLFTICLGCSFLTTLSYGLEAAPAALLGLFSYAGAFPAVLLGFHYVRHDYREIEPPLVIFTVLTSLMLIGVVLEYRGVKFSAPWLGTIAMSEEWVRWYATGKAGIAMISGFYRSPEIMGWHAMLMVLVCAFLLLRRPSLAVVWIPLAAWGMYGVLLSGRRKMFVMVLVFLVMMLLQVRGRLRVRLVAYVGAGGLVLAWILSGLTDERYIAAAQSGLDVAGAKATEKGIGGPLWLTGLVGPFGYGVGTKTQGGQHLGRVVETPQVEGGFERIMVELGLVGTGAVAFLLWTTIRLVLKELRLIRRSRFETLVPITLVSILVANLSAFLVAFQIFGDPFVVFILGFLGGTLLSASRLIRGPLESPSAVRRAMRQPRTPAVSSISPESGDLGQEP